MLDGFDWVSQQRRRTMREVDGKKVAYWGLLPAASAHDWLAGNTIFNDAYCIYGMTEVVRLLREIKHPRAEEMARELNDYRRCLRERYVEARDRARRAAAGRRHDDSVRAADGGGTGLGQARLDLHRLQRRCGPGPGARFDPHDELVDQALAYLEAGMPKGEGCLLLRNGRSGHRRRELGRHQRPERRAPLPVAALRRVRDDVAGRRPAVSRPRRPAAVFRVVRSTISPSSIHQDFRVGVESLDGVPSCAPGDGERWQAMRKMFVNEFGGYDGSRAVAVAPAGDSPRVAAAGRPHVGQGDGHATSAARSIWTCKWPTTETPWRSMPNCRGLPSSRKKSASACAPATAARWPRRRSTANPPQFSRAT